MPAFDGVRVLELGQIYNGPYCGLLFAQLGADVIKVEPPGGEPLRFRSHDPVESHEFVMLNSNKRSVVLDLKTDAGRQALLDLVGDRRRAHRELRAGHHGAPAAQPGAAPGAQPAPGGGLRQGLRVHAAPTRTCPPWTSPCRRCPAAPRPPGSPTGRRPRPAPRSWTSPAASTCSPRSARPCSSASAPGGGRSSRCRCTTPSTRCWRRAWAACTTTPTESSPNAPGTGTRAWRSRRTTSTRRATDGWRSSASPSGTGAAWQPHWAGPS